VLPEHAIKEARILIVDDRRKNAVVLERLLHEDGYRQVKVLPDPDTIQAACTVFPPDLVILDLEMSHARGLTVLERLKPLGTGTYLPILVLTDSMNREVKRQALSAGAKDYLVMPIDAIEALLRIKNLLLTRSLYIELLDQNLKLEGQVAERTQSFEHAQGEIITHLSAAAEYRDDDTGQHTRRVGLLSEKLARAVGMPENSCRLLRRASTLHDVGKIGIPDALLLKPGHLTGAEWETMKTHVPIGVRILSGSPFPVMQVAEAVAGGHHEWWDGTGYPNGLKGEQIPLSARIVAVVDVFDTLTHRRPYREAAFPLRDALDELISRRGTQFEPRLVDLFIKVLETDGVV